MKHKGTTLEGYVTCLVCAKSKLMQYYDCNINDPVIAECRGERYVAGYHTCAEAEKAKGVKPITRIDKRKTA